ncbi:hypothetical protein WOLCODRAFT_144787 [Wolfiporia cocos MD-104 SS10]|uniref:Secreted protein n=1 Tax=Wolfiporia cocos (strain MD-104) TaxID=742152 RepID=A0A2H3JVJ6_WOLCO|nr:hypothetical protein WOLCODRAFT_144787 [Wolfiporia cocos MD-104 SS10]
MCPSFLARLLSFKIGLLARTRPPVIVDKSQCANSIKLHFRNLEPKKPSAGRAPVHRPGTWIEGAWQCCVKTTTIVALGEDSAYCSHRRYTACGLSTLVWAASLASQMLRSPI